MMSPEVFLIAMISIKNRPKAMLNIQSSVHTSPTPIFACFYFLNSSIETHAAWKNTNLLTIFVV